MNEPRRVFLFTCVCTMALAGCMDDPVATMAEADSPPAAAATVALERQPPHKLLELVAPIALYPDVLVAQMLIAATHPAEISHAGVWLEQAPSADAAQLAQAVDNQPWSPDIKALTLLSPVLDALNRNYAWTVALGEAYAEEPTQVLRAVQALRHKAQAAGKLAATGAQLVINDGDTILIEPADPRRASVPGGKAYDIATFERFDWGWHSWALDWRHGAVMYQDAPLLAEAD